MNSSEKTFDVLRQPSVEDMLDEIHTLRKLSPAFQVGHSAINRGDYYDNFTFHLDSIRLLKDRGWEIEDFHRALEKKSILSLIQDYNTSLIFPNELLDRAKAFFPNVKFVNAHIDLGE